MSAAKEALEDLRGFRTDITGFLDAVSSALSGSSTAAKPWDIDQKALAVRNSGDKLEKTLEQVRVFQTHENALRDLRSELKRRTDAIRRIGIVLEQSELGIEDALKRANKFSSAAPTVKSSPVQNEVVTVDSVLQLARKLSFITHAPAGWHYKQGRNLPDRFHPPAPQMDDMKKSKLFKRPDQLVAAYLKQQQPDQAAASTSEQVNGNGTSSPKVEEEIDWEETDGQDQQESVEHASKRMRIDPS